jgi:GH15 family glucan-1,4-alpha-glucosidase
VRVGNQAHEHVQNDVYGEMIVSISRMLLDSRFAGTAGLDQAVAMVQRLMDQIEARMLQPDAGLWELRQQTNVHSFSLLMHWAGARRAADIGEFLGASDLKQRALRIMERARQLLEERCWNDRVGALTQSMDADNLDAAMLLAIQFRFWPAEDPRAHSHVEAIRRQLTVAEGGMLRRYDVEDDFGTQEAAFTVCSFWLAEAMAIIGRRDEAKELFDHLLSLGNELGLYSEDILPASGAQSGNFPQTYSHVGLINTAFELSRGWYA